VVFTGDETQKTVTVPLIDDTAEESREEFRLVITIVEGGTTGAISNVTITVIDDDAPDTTEPPTTDKPPAVEPPSYERPATPSVPSGCASLEPPSGKIGPPPTEMLAALSLLALAALRKRLVPRERVPVRIRH